jgi:uncharacterized protein
MKVLRWVGIILVVLLVLVYIGLPVVMGIVAVLPVKQLITNVPAGYQDVTLRTEDGVELKAWYRPPENGAVILLLHGAGGSRSSMLPYGKMLSKHGYGVFLLDQRGHGESKGKINRLGWEGTKDVAAAVAYLLTKNEVTQIGGLGSSMGGEVLLGAASSIPQIKAIVADGATPRSLDEYLALEENRPLVQNFTVRVMYLTVQLASGEKPPQPPLLDSIQKAESTRYQFIAAGNNPLEISFNQLFADTLGNRASLWIASGVDHTGASLKYPDEYEQRVIDFFQSAFSK